MTITTSIFHCGRKSRLLHTRQRARADREITKKTQLIQYPNAILFASIALLPLSIMVRILIIASIENSSPKLYPKNLNMPTTLFGLTILGLNPNPA